MIFNNIFNSIFNYKIKYMFEQCNIKERKNE